jgi:hypothetical protein
LLTGCEQEKPAQAPAISVAPSSLSFKGKETVGIAAQKLTLTNNGAQDVTVVLTTAGASTTDPGPLWLSRMPTTFTLPAGSSASISVRVDTAGMAAGTYRGHLIISAGAQTLPVRVDLVLMANNQVLIVVAEDDGWTNRVYINRIRFNTAQEAISDFRKLGYSAWQEIATTSSPRASTILSGIQGVPQPLGLVLLSHGDPVDFCAPRTRCARYRTLEPAGGWGKTWNYVILHACESDSAATAGVLQPPKSAYFKGWPYKVMMQSIFYWQWWRFPSEGPHDGAYELIDLSVFDELTAEQAVAIPSTEPIDIPSEAEAEAMKASYLMAEAHNMLIEGNEDLAVGNLWSAYSSLLRAYDAGWELAQPAAAELAYILMDGQVWLDFRTGAFATGQAVSLPDNGLGLRVSARGGGPAYIVDDGGLAVLSGRLDDFGGPLDLTFLHGGVDTVEIEAGMFDEVGSLTIEAFDWYGNLLSTISNTADNDSLEMLTLTGPGIHRIELRDNGDGPWAVHTLAWWENEIDHAAISGGANP